MIHTGKFCVANIKNINVQCQRFKELDCNNHRRFGQYKHPGSNDQEKRTKLFRTETQSQNVLRIVRQPKAHFSSLKKCLVTYIFIQENKYFLTFFYYQDTVFSYSLRSLRQQIFGCFGRSFSKSSVFASVYVLQWMLKQKLRVSICFSARPVADAKIEARRQ